MQSSMPNTAQSTAVTRRYPWLSIMLFAFVVALYYVARYHGQWAETDSAGFARYIRSFVIEGRLTPINGSAYPNGYAYQSISAFLLMFTGLDVATLQQIVYPLTACLLVLPAWVLYRELTASSRGATLATMLLFTQPEFLFVILRSSHEKFTRTLLLLCLFFLVRSLTLNNRPGLFALHVGLFYLVAFAFIASNNLLAHSFIFAVGLALVLGRMLEKRAPHLQSPGSALLQRLPYATLICLGLAYLFTFYAYPPAQHDLLVMEHIWDQVAALFLDVQSEPTNAYATVVIGWINLPVYFSVSLANWLIFAASLIIWLRRGQRWLRRGETPASQMDWLLWLLYAAFVMQGVLSIVADASGALGSNLQHRIFPSFSIIAVGTVGTTLARWRPRRMPKPLRFGLALAAACLSLLSVSKAVNEPLLSNKWTMYQHNELAAIDWSDAHLENADLWTEFDERLGVAFHMTHEGSKNGNRFLGKQLKPTMRHLIVTDLTRLRGYRLQRVAPVPSDALRVYDNGMAEVYELRPRTPFQK